MISHLLVYLTFLNGHSNVKLTRSSSIMKLTNSALCIVEIVSAKIYSYLLHGIISFIAFYKNSSKRTGQEHRVIDMKNILD